VIPVIDWITITAPLPHADSIGAGRVVSIDSNGVPQWETVKRLSVRGSFSSSITVRSCTHTATPFSHVEISGNPAKLFQGHNLWGTDDLPALVYATLEFIANRLSIPVCDRTRAEWRAGDVQLTRVDCTESFHLASKAEVLAWLRAAEQTAHLSHRGRGQLCKGSTLYFGKNSRRSSLKFYSKGQEITAKDHGQDSILGLPAAVDWANKTLRAELTIRSMELKRLNLSHVRDWITDNGVPSVVTAQLLRHQLGSITMTTIHRLPATVLGSLRPSLQTAYLAWESGADLRHTLSRATFYRYRSELLPHGIDLATLNPKDVSNVVPLHRVLEAIPVGVPDWAKGTPLYWEPNRVA
jgi:II/X family phage/plasmid replication protein